MSLAHTCGSMLKQTSELHKRHKAPIYWFFYFVITTNICIIYVAKYCVLNDTQDFVNAQINLPWISLPKRYHGHINPTRLISPWNELLSGIKSGKLSPWFLPLLKLRNPTSRSALLEQTGDETVQSWRHRKSNTWSNRYMYIHHPSNNNYIFQCLLNKLFSLIFPELHTPLFLEQRREGTIDNDEI